MAVKVEVSEVVVLVEEEMEVEAMVEVSEPVVLVEEEMEVEAMVEVVLVEEEMVAGDVPAVAGDMEEGMVETMVVAKVAERRLYTFHHPPSRCCRSWQLLRTCTRTCRTRRRRWSVS